MKRYNRKNTRACDNRFRPNYDITISSLIMGIKTCKQLIIPVTNRRQQNILERNHLKYSKSKRQQNKQNSHVHIKIQQIILTQAFKIIIRDKSIAKRTTTS